MGTLATPSPEYSWACCCWSFCRFWTAWATARSMSTISDRVGRGWEGVECSGDESWRDWRKLVLEYRSDWEVELGMDRDP